MINTVYIFIISITPKSLLIIVYIIIAQPTNTAFKVSINSKTTRNIEGYCNSITKKTRVKKHFLQFNLQLSFHWIKAIY